MTVMAFRTTLMATSKQTSSQLLNMMLVLLLSVAVSQLARHLEPDDLSANPGAGPTQPILKTYPATEKGGRKRAFSAT